MFKKTIKVMFLALAIAGGLAIVSGDKAAAAPAASFENENCPSAPGDNWGNHGVVKEGDGVMASMTMRAEDSSGDPINTRYTINSRSQQANKSLYPDGQIFNYDMLKAGNYGPGFRTTEKSFWTGENLRGGASGDYACNGWSQLAAGRTVKGERLIGNGYILDCLTGDKPIEYWIDDVGIPAGETGKWKLQKWNKYEQRWVELDGDVNAGKSKKFIFNVENGDNIKMRLVWFGDNPAPEPPELECNYLKVNSYGPYEEAEWVEGRWKGSGKSREWVPGFWRNVDRNTRAVVEMNGAYIVKSYWPGGESADQGYTNKNLNGDVPDASGSENPDQWKRWNMVPFNKQIKVKIQYQYLKDGKTWTNFNGVAGSKNPPAPNRDRGYGAGTSPITCYKPSCTVNAVQGKLFDNFSVEAGKPVKVSVTINNPDPNSNRDAVPLRQAYVTGPATSSQVSIPANRSKNLPIMTINAPGTVQNWELEFTLKSDVADGLNSENIKCSKTVPIYKSFGISLSSSVTPNTGTEEDPVSLDYYTKITNSTGAAVSVDTTSEYYKKPGGSGKNLYISTPDSTAENGDSYPIRGLAWPVPQPVVAGDQFCARITSTYTTGYVGPGGGVVGTGSPGDSGESCVTVNNKPYFKAYGKGVRAGGNYQSDGSCSGGGLLASWYNYQGGKNNGASSQLSALANIKITGYASAQTGSNRSPTALTFANTTEASNGTPSPPLGGEYNAPHCLYEPAQPTTVPAGSSTENVTGNKTIGPSTTTVSTNRSIFATGDVYISGDIELSGGVTSSSFVVKAGRNIYIAPNVKRLDGVYVAKGNIYTCSNATGTGPKQTSDSGPGNSYYTVCNKQLLIRGTFVAKKVSLMRTYGSLRNSVNNEQLRGPSNAPINGACANSGGAPPIPIAKSCAAEVFDFGPELYLSNPAVQLPNGGSTTYDAITSLPPVL